MNNISKFWDHTKKYGVVKASSKSIDKLKALWFLQLRHLIRKIGITHKNNFLPFICNVCSTACMTKTEELKREEPSCPGCASTVRTRALIHVLSTELFGKSLAISDFPYRTDINGIGMSDQEGYASRLKDKLGYSNTYYHKEPVFDITEIDPALEGTLDFIISTDVFEHVEPPVAKAFENAQNLLKEGGVFIFTAPYTSDGETKEHFPNLYQYEIQGKGNERILKNITRDGVEETFSNLVFHGGMGATLELRSFTETSLLEEFRKAGFNNVKVYNEPYYKFGIVWERDLSLPIAARIK
jgi:SAM-dependent methyltransferase